MLGEIVILFMFVVIVWFFYLMITKTNYAGEYEGAGKTKRKPKDDRILKPNQQMSWED